MKASIVTLRGLGNVYVINKGQPGCEYKFRLTKAQFATLRSNPRLSDDAPVSYSFGGNLTVEIYACGSGWYQTITLNDVDGTRMPRATCAMGRLLHELFGSEEIHVPTQEPVHHKKSAIPLPVHIEWRRNGRQPHRIVVVDRTVSAQCNRERELELLVAAELHKPSLQNLLARFGKPQQSRHA